MFDPTLSRLENHWPTSVVVPIRVAAVDRVPSVRVRRLAVDMAAVEIAVIHRTVAVAHVVVIADEHHALGQRQDDADGGPEHRPEVDADIRVRVRDPKSKADAIRHHRPDHRQCRQ